LGLSDALALTASWPVSLVAAGVAGTDEVLATTGPIDDPLPWASVTKLLTTVAALVALEEGTIALDQPAGPAGSTVRHLLAHASGLPLDGEGRRVAPATRRIYSNLGIELVAERVAGGAGIPFKQYLIEGVLIPLGMADTRLGGSPAWGAYGPLRDLMALAGELLAPKLMSPETLRLATEVAFPNLNGILPGYGMQKPNDWALGFELRDHKSPHWTGTANSPATFGHFGQTGSFLWVDPTADLACASLADRDFGVWAKRAWPALSDAVLAEFGPSPMT
jgi:CubicO group peptidase (beta-lactamase class C family)